MSTIKIVTDDAGDIPLKHEDLYDIEVLPIRVTLGDESYLSRKELDSAEFYEMMEVSEDFPETMPISSFEFGELFGDLFEQGYTDVIYVSSCSGGSPIYYNAIRAREQFFEDNPDAEGKINIYCIDSGSYSAGYGYAVVEAAKMAEREKSAEEIVEYLEDWFSSARLCFGLYSLKFAKKSALLPSDFATVGELIGLRPVMMVKDGKIEILSKARESSLVSEVAETALNEIEKGSPYCIVYSNDSEQRDELSALLTAELGYPPADSYRIGAAVATHAGYEAIGLVFKGQ